MFCDRHRCHARLHAPGHHTGLANAQLLGQFGIGHGTQQRQRLRRPLKLLGLGKSRNAQCVALEVDGLGRRAPALGQHSVFFLTQLGQHLRGPLQRGLTHQ